MAARKVVSEKAVPESKPSQQSSSLTTVMVLGFEGGSITVAHESKRDEFWLRVDSMPMSFWDSEADDDSPPAEWTRGLSWSQVMVRLRERSWWRLEPIEVHAEHREQMRRELEQLRLSSGWSAWLDAPSRRMRRPEMNRS